jgi:hypothetical protein
VILTAEEMRLQEFRERKVQWKRWGPYLSERAWGTVREDYSARTTTVITLAPTDGKRAIGSIGHGFLLF